MVTWCLVKNEMWGYVECHCRSRWSRVTDLLKKRDEFTAGSSECRMRTSDDSVDSESEQTEDFDEFSDWRAGGK